MRRRATFPARKLHVAPDSRLVAYEDELSRRENERRFRACGENSASPLALGIIALNRVTSGRTCARNSRRIAPRASFLRELWNQSAPARADAFERINITVTGDIRPAP